MPVQRIGCKDIKPVIFLRKGEIVRFHTVFPANNEAPRKHICDRDFRLELMVICTAKAQKAVLVGVGIAERRIH